jgi:putative addiction module component (TIGR02574 family)
MTVDPTQILSAALSLSDDERAGLAFRLLQSLKPAKVLSDEDPAFEGELDRRVDAYEAGETSASDWDEVSERVRDALKKRKSQ